jgi:nucleoside-diphosphate-sugar epimerase
MRVFLAGATGVLGRALIPHLLGHQVVGLTRDPARTTLLHELGAEAAVADAYDRESLIRVVVDAQPEVVVNFLTDLAARSSELGWDDLKKKSRHQIIRDRQASEREVPK